MTALPISPNRSTDSDTTRSETVPGVLTERVSISNAVDALLTPRGVGGALLETMLIDLIADPHRRWLTTLEQQRLDCKHADPASTVVVLSALGAENPGADRFSNELAQRERQVVDLIPTAVVLRCAPLVEDLAVFIPTVTSGDVAFHAFGVGAAPWLSADELIELVARIALEHLRNETDRRGHAFDVTGPRPVHATELLDTLAAASAQTRSCTNHRDASVESTPCSQRLDPDVLADALATVGFDPVLVTEIISHQVWAGVDRPVVDPLTRALGRAPSDPVAVARSLVCSPVYAAEGER